MEQTGLLHEFSEPEQIYATSGQRFANYLIDLIAFYLCNLAVGALIGLAAPSLIENDDEPILIFISFAIFFGYYILFETIKGQTLGKMVTKTKVVNESGDLPSLSQVFTRTLIRIVPFEFISAFSSSQMWHDRWSHTKTIKIS